MNAPPTRSNASSPRATARAPRGRLPLTALLVTALLLAGAGPAACGGEPPPTPPPPPAPGDVVVRLGPVAITAGEIAAWVEALSAIDPRLGVDHRRRAALDKHLIPLALARAELAEQRAPLREQAESLRRVLGNEGPLELRRRGRGLGGVDYELVRFGQLPLAPARWAFAEESFGQVSPPIETPQGWAVLGVIDRRDGLTTADARVTVHIVHFVTHRSGEFQVWYDAWKERLRDAPREIHHDYEDALPTWSNP